VGYIDKRIVAAAVGANGSASLRKTGCQGILLRGEVLFIAVDAKALNPLKTTSIQGMARTEPIAAIINDLPKTAGER
jgi:hypothetical protein